jgi:hypothetical protein
MRFSLISAISLFLLILIISIPLTQTPAGELKGDDGWYEVLLNGEKIGFEHHSLQLTTYKGKKCYQYNETSEGRIKINDRVTVVETVSTTYFSTDMKPIYQKSVTKEMDQVISTEIIITDREIIFKKNLGATETVKKIPWRQGYTFSATGPLLKFKGLDVGKKYTLKAIYEDKSSIEDENVEIVKRDKMAVDGKERDCVLVRIFSSALPGIPFLTWVDEAGRVLKTKTVAIESIRTTRQTALIKKNMGTYSNRIMTSQLLPPSEELQEMRIIMNIDEENPRDLLENNDYQQTALDKGALILRLKAVRPEKSSHESSLTKEEREKYLAPSVLIESEDPEIIKKAVEITHRFDDKLSQIKMLCAWVYYSLKKEESRISSQSAKETLRSESGDCTEHTVLFCALARALGIPSREVCGLVFTGDSFGFHAWAEAYCSTWIPVDATVNRVGIPACYIELGNDAEGKPTLESTAKLVKMLNKTSFEIERLTIGDKVFNLKDPQSYGEIDGNRCRQLLWALSVEKPNEWSFRFDDAHRLFIQNACGAAVSLYPLYSITGKGSQMIEEEVKKEAMEKGQSFSFLKPQYRSMKNYSMYEVPYIVTGTLVRGSAVLAIHEDRAFMIILRAPGEHYDPAYGEFEKILESLQF